MATMASPSRWSGMEKVHDFIDGFGLCSHRRGGNPMTGAASATRRMRDLASSTFECLLGGVRESVQDVTQRSF